MTREEAIRFIEQSDLFWNRATEEEREALNMAIEALSQPIVAKCYEIDSERVYCPPEIADKIYRALHEDTNVQNMHKGKWIDRSEGGKIRNPWWESHKCDQCGYVGSGVWRFCPNCGADMRGGAK